MGSIELPLGRRQRAAVVQILFACLLFVSPGNASPLADGKPHLAVIVVFDQMRADYLERWQDLFGDSGFRRLMHKGAWYRACNYPYANTLTASGHASIVTGCSPKIHGIIGNDWYDRSVGAEVAAVSSGRKTGAGPDRLRAPTLSDSLWEATDGRGKTVSLSLKDRSAILLAGHHPAGCYWFDTGSGRFVTSTFYAEVPHRWVAEFNALHRADDWFGKTWERCRPDLDYAQFSGADDQVGKSSGVAQGRAFPHPMTGGVQKVGKKFYDALYNSPYGNELLLELAKRAIEAEKFGRHDVPDLLCLSFSSNDAIGHAYGPDSQEVLDVTLRSDKIMADLLACLDEHVGAGRYVLALTADHGVCPLPEVERARGRDAERISGDVLGAKAESYLNEKFGAGTKKTRWVEATSNLAIYLNHAMLKERGLSQEVAEAELADWLKTQRGILGAYTRTQLLKPLPDRDAIGEALRRSFDPDRCGDVLIVSKPYYLFSWLFATGTTHGSPHPYDTHVPLLVYGPGIRPGEHEEAVSPLATAAILAQSMGIILRQRARLRSPQDSCPRSEYLPTVVSIVKHDMLNRQLPSRNSCSDTYETPAMRFLAECGDFLRESRNNFRDTGALMPSSRFLAQALASELRRRREPARILEVGPGTGAVTARILRHLLPTDKLDLVELNSRFIRILEHRFDQEWNFWRHREQVRIIHSPLENLSTEVQYDYIISGLPLNNFPVDLVRTIFRSFRRLLKPGGTLSYFEYELVRQLKTPFTSKSERRRLHRVGRVVGHYIDAYQIRKQRILINVPPAIVRHLRFQPAEATTGTEPNARSLVFEMV